MRRAGVGFGSRAVAPAFAFVFAFAAMFAAPPAEAQNPDSIGAQVTIDQNAIMRQFVPPLRRPPTVDIRVEAPVGGGVRHSLNRADPTGKRRQEPVRVPRVALHN